MPAAAGSPLRSLREHPFELLRELERRGKVALAGGSIAGTDVTEWVGIGFRLGAEQFLMARQEVREVLMVPSSLTRIPGAKAWIKGLANVRGHLLPVVDLRAFLGAGSGGSSRTSRVLVLNDGEFPVGLLVDEVYGFRRFLDREHEQGAPETLIRCDRFLAGSFRRGEEVWPVFSSVRLLATEEFSRAADT